MRVLIGVEALGVGGKERQAIELIKGLTCRADIDSRIVCFDTPDFYLDHLTTLNIPVEFMTRRARWDLGVFSRLHRTLKHYRPHVMHTNGLMSSFYLLPLAKRLRIPLINGCIRNAFSGGDPRWWVEKVLARMSDYRIANSRAGLQSWGFAHDHTRNVVIYNGFDFSRVDGLASADFPCQFVPGARGKTVGMVAEFNRYKDYSTFVQVARMLSARRHDVRFVAVGDGEVLRATEERAADVSAITFLGQRKDIEELVRTFDVGVLATFTEGISNSIMEYMAMRKPVVATDGGGTRELVVDGETGFLVPSRDPGAMAAKIAYLLDNPELARRMGEAGEARLRRDFSLTRMVEETIRVYERALADAKPPACASLERG